MAATTLKTFHADTMAAALAEVKKNLGDQAVILHTRSFKVGGVMGVGARDRVEITASTDTGQVRPRRVRARPEIPGRPPIAAPEQVFTSRTAPNETGEFIARPPWFSQSETEKPERIDPKPVAARPTPAPARTAAPVAETVTAGARPAPPPPRSGAARLSAGRVEPKPTTPEAREAIEDELAAIRRLVGQVLQSTRRVEARSDRTPADAPERGPLQCCLVRLLENEVATEVADDLSAAVRDALHSDELARQDIVRDAVLREIARRIRTSDESAPPERTETGRPSVIALIGPTGVGKTTTVAKLAATYKLRHGRRVGLVTADTYRIAAVEQLRTYADIVGLPLKVALSPGDMRDAIDSLADCDVVLVDTAGRSQHDEARLAELAEMLEAAAPDATHLVLSLAASESVIAAAAKRFAGLGPHNLILSKLDEAVDFGGIANVTARIDLPLSFVTTGQEVPDHIERADADRLARLVLDGREAWRSARGSG